MQFPREDTRKADVAQGLSDTSIAAMPPNAASPDEGAVPRLTDECPIVSAVQAQLEKHMGNEEDPDVTIPRLKLQLEACKCLKKHRREEKKREAEEAKKARR